MSTKSMVLNMDDVLQLLDDASDLAEALHGLDMYEEQGRKSPGSAAIRREMNRLADRLTLASALVKDQYWAGQPARPFAMGK